MCLYPKLILNPKYKQNQKNGGNPPPIQDQRTKYVPIGCGNCIECRKQKAREWQIRLMEDIKEHTNGKFITLTFSEESLTKIQETVILNSITQNLEPPTKYYLDNAVAIYATKHFLGRYRKKYNNSLRHWLITELGHNGTQRIHLHGIIWTDHPLQTIEEIWSYGWIWKGKQTLNKITKQIEIQNYVNEKTINYIIKYVNKTDQTNPQYKSIILTTPGIGANYIKKKQETLQETNSTDQTQTKPT